MQCDPTPRTEEEDYENCTSLCQNVTALSWWLSGLQQQTKKERKESGMRNYDLINRIHDALAVLVSVFERVYRGNSSPTAQILF